ncbi:MAG: DUF1887 family CARF protein [Kiritimatiellae bacterium]|nr:DUF1887 family CARF protein [Kiritimatiellia bacterium]
MATRTQICLMSGEVMPNVIGILLDKPDRAVSIVTDQSRAQVEPLRRALSAATCRSVIEPAREVEPFDGRHCASLIRSITAEAGGEVCVNWTGGTKMMSCAARRVAEEQGWRSLYVNTQGLEVIVEGAGEPLTGRHPIFPAGPWR